MTAIPKSPRKQLLVVDDDYLTIEMIKSYFNATFEVRTADSVQRALTLIEAKPPDVVITDLVLPLMGGIELLEIVRRDFPQIAVVIISGWGSHADISKALKLGASNFLEKPFDAKMLVSAVEKALELCGASNEDDRPFDKSQFSPSPEAKKFLFDEAKISPAALHRLYRLSTASFGALRHDANNALSMIAALCDRQNNQIDRIEGAVSQASPSTQKLFQGELAGLRQSANHIRECATQASALVKRYASDFQPHQFQAVFVAKPAAIIRSLAANYRVEIKCVGDESLEIVFPENVLVALISELIANTEAHSKSDNPAVLIRWFIAGDFFECQVHDNGHGFGVNCDGMFPCDVLPITQHSRESHGLRMVNRIALDASGLLLLGTSTDLGGALVTFKVLVSDYYSDTKRG